MVAPNRNRLPLKSSMKSAAKDETKDIPRKKVQLISREVKEERDQTDQKGVWDTIQTQAQEEDEKKGYPKLGSHFGTSEARYKNAKQRSKTSASPTQTTDIEEAHKALEEFIERENEMRNEISSLVTKQRKGVRKYKPVSTAAPFHKSQGPPTIRLMPAGKKSDSSDQRSDHTKQFDQFWTTDEDEEKVRPGTSDQPNVQQANHRNRASSQRDEPRDGKSKEPT